jgi:hypothetical protein
MNEHGVNPAPPSRRDFLHLGTASVAGLAVGGLSGTARAQPPDLRVAELPREQVALLEGPTILPAVGRHEHGGTLAGTAGNPETPRVDPDNRKNPNFKPDGSRRERDDKEPPRYRVELICRTFVGDTGVRPLASNFDFWDSPDIWVEPPGGSGPPRAGVNNTVKVHVWNLGLADSWGTSVDLYWCNPSVGVNAASAHPIGSQTVPLQSGQHKVLSFVWNPVYENGGHECLVAQVYDPVADPLVVPFNPLLDRHVAQHNIDDLVAAPGERVSLDFFVPNLSKRAVTSTLEVERLSPAALHVMAAGLGRKELRAAPVGQIGLTPPVVQDARPAVALSAMPGAAVFRETLQGAPPPKEAHLLAGTLQMLAARGEKRLLKAKVVPAQLGPGKLAAKYANDLAPKREVRIEPGKELHFALVATVPKEAARGTAQVYRVVERVEGKITGALTVVVETR